MMHVGLGLHGKCLKTHITHSLCPKWDFGLKNMKTMCEEINLRFKGLSPNNILLIDDCPYKCIRNPPFFLHLTTSIQ